MNCIHRCLTGRVDKRTLEKYQNEAREKSHESWYWAWLLDTNEEERDKLKKSILLFLMHLVMDVSLQIWLLVQHKLMLLY
jgi:translation elongation factor EF-1alpha